MIPEKDNIGYINGLYATSIGGGGITSIEICPIRVGENFQLKLARKKNLKKKLKFWKK